jgi:hypothetical protein
MTDLSRLADMAEVLGVLIVIGGVFFAVVQLRQIRQQRREMAAIELFRFFGSPDFAEAYRCVLRLPDGLSRAETRKQLGTDASYAMFISTTMENIGVMVYHRIVPYVVVNNLMGTSTPVLWRKLENWVGGVREDMGNPAAFEWFEWLAITMEKYGDDNRAPVYLSCSDWKPSRPSQEL